MSQFNTKDISIGKFAELIEFQILSEQFTTPILGLGKAGIGKTEGIRGVANKLKIGIKEIRLCNMTETDLIGIPKIEKTPSGEEVTTYAGNTLLPRVERDGEVGILVLDEITSAQPNVAATSLQLMDTARGVGNYKLPPKWLVVALGNGPEDGGIYVGLVTAQLTRALTYNVVTNVKSWKHWAIQSGVDPTVLAYISNDPSKLYVDVAADSEYGAEVTACPRSWAGLSTMLKNRTKFHGGVLDKDDVEIYAAGFIGNALASKFSAFYAFNTDLIDLNAIVDGTAPTDLGNIRPEVMYLTAQNLVHNVNALLQDDILEHNEIQQETVGKISKICDWVSDVALHHADLAMMVIQDLANNVPPVQDVLLDPHFGSEKFMKYVDTFTKVRKSSGAEA